MATTKKAPAKKKTTTRAAAVKKKAPAKKTTAKKGASKKAPVRKAPSKRRTNKASTASFKVAAEETPFLTFKVTRQTVYWIILVAFIIFVQLWIISLQVEVAGLLEAQQRLIYDSL